MLDDAIRTQLAAYLQRITQPVELVASLDDRPAALEMRTLLEEIAELSPLVTARSGFGKPLMRSGRQRSISAVGCTRPSTS